MRVGDNLTFDGDFPEKAIGGSDVCHTCAAHVLVITEDLEPRIRSLEAELAETKAFLVDEKAVRRNAEDLLDSAYDTLDYFGHSPPYDGSQANANQERIRTLAADLAHSEKHRDQNRETAVALQLRVSALEQDVTDVAKINVDLMIRNRALEAACKTVQDTSIAHAGKQNDRIRELEADNIDLRQLICQWQKNCTGMNGSQMPCGMSADHTLETSAQREGKS
jgi:uncharacterized small protein (DUF1192 family)